MMMLPRGDFDSSRLGPGIFWTETKTPIGSRASEWGQRVEQHLLRFTAHQQQQQQHQQYAVVQSI